MIPHLVRLIWNRRRTNGLILAELAAAFLVLAALGTAASYYLYNLRQPLGFAIDDVYVAGVGHGITRREGSPPEKVTAAVATSKRLLETVRELPEVEAATAALTGPYVSGMRNTLRADGDDIPPLGRGLLYDVDNVSDDFAKVFGLRVVKGRWFSREDDGANYDPAVINEQLARDFFGVENPIGQQMSRRSNGRAVRVVGVIEGYRQRGELAPPLRYMLRRYLPGHEDELPYHKIFVKTRAGTSADFEAKLERRLRATADPDWAFNIRYLPDVRAGVRKVELLPLTCAAIIGAFLMIMVVLGLTGVLWQNVTQRTREIGLRRAKGATRPFIYGQILGELMVMTTVAIALGIVLLGHVPLLGLVDDMHPSIYLSGAAAAALALYLLTAICGYYPARLAARVSPAFALRTE